MIKKDASDIVNRISMRMDASQLISFLFYLSNVWRLLARCDWMHLKPFLAFFQSLSPFLARAPFSRYNNLPDQSLSFIARSLTCATCLPVSLWAWFGMERAKNNCVAKSPFPYKSRLFFQLEHTSLDIPSWFVSQLLLQDFPYPKVSQTKFYYSLASAGKPNFII